MGQLKIPENRQKSQIFMNYRSRKFAILAKSSFWLKTCHSNAKFYKDYENSSHFAIRSIFAEILATSGDFRKNFTPLYKKYKMNCILLTVFSNFVSTDVIW
ncbi:hypothetical protein GHT06_020060 [Daphnia sinensis]|uniref:Uncharacterized protein n=1 Tax=Daphnia sinensis TaxID=1820382 RepID=A0AAD5L2Z8_9CRUS|nr:hypothetical protein GHT06_020060 [Daphnia sinensis]